MGGHAVACSVGITQGGGMIEVFVGDGLQKGLLAAIVLIVAVAGLSWAAIWALQPIARRLGLLDHPRGDRKLHACATPVTGGLGMVLAVVLLFLFDPVPMTLARWAFLLGSALLVVVGLLDDIFDLRWWWRILAQIAAALIMVYLGDVRVEQLGRAFGLDDLSLGALSVPFTVFATVGLINAINMIDGADGVAGILVAAALSMLGAAAWYAGNQVLAFISLGLCAAVVGFLLHNFPVPWRPGARVFMGNAGSAFLGYVIAWISFRLTQNSAHPVSPVLALWLVAIPVMDCLVLIVRRLREGRSPFSADRNHIHHLMRDAGFSSAGLALVLVAAALIMGLVIAQAMRMDIPDPVLLGLYVMMCAGWYLASSDRRRVISLMKRLRNASEFDVSRNAIPVPAVQPAEKTVGQPFLSVKPPEG